MSEQCPRCQSLSEELRNAESDCESQRVDYELQLDVANKRIVELERAGSQLVRQWDSMGSAGLAEYVENLRDTIPQKEDTIDE